MVPKRLLASMRVAQCLFHSVNHSAGSVLVDYTMTLDKPTTSSNLTEAFTQGVSNLNFTVDVASISFTGEFE